MSGLPFTVLSGAAICGFVAGFFFTAANDPALGSGFVGATIVFFGYFVIATVDNAMEILHESLTQKKEQEHA
jgi:hypothetical protein